MTALITILILALGGGTVAVTSDSAKPGDFLYSVDRTLEDMQLELARSDEKKADLTKEFTEERLKELNEIIDEEIVVSPAIDQINTATSSANETDLMITAKVYVDTTVIKFEFAGKELYFETEANNRAEIIVAIQELFSMLSIEKIESSLNIVEENRESRLKDKGVVSVSPAGETRIKSAIESLLTFLDETNLDGKNKKNYINLLDGQVTGVTEFTRVERSGDTVVIGGAKSPININLKDDGDSQIEIQNDKQKLSIETKDKTVSVVEEPQPYVKTQTIDSSVTLNFSAEAQIFTDTTVVKLVFDDEDLYVSTQAKTRLGIIAAIKEDFPALADDLIDANLTIEKLNRVSVPEDSGQVSVPVVTNKIKSEREHEDDEEDEEDEEDEDEREYEDD